MLNSFMEGKVKESLPVQYAFSSNPELLFLKQLPKKGIGIIHMICVKITLYFLMYRKYLVILKTCCLHFAARN
jgi:hypothetical protein